MGSLSFLSSGYGASALRLPLPRHLRLLPTSMALSTPRPPPQFDLPSYLHSKSRSISIALDRAVPLRQPSRVFETMRYSIFSDSSRICPLLCISACELLGGSEHLAMPTACALEMLHTASLIHDDLPCMDDDDVRRGKAANHKVFGEDMALLAGDALYALAVEHVARATEGASGDVILRIISELGKAVGSQGMVTGQYLEMVLNGAQSVSFEHLQGIHLMKTSSLSECATVCGALLGGAEEEQKENLRQYGRKLGLLYEVVKDVADAAQSGQRSKSLSEKQKSTYSGLLGLEKCKELAEQLGYKTKEHLSSFDTQGAMPLLCFVDNLTDKI